MSEDVSTRRGERIEKALALAVLLGGIVVLVQSFWYSYLPPPFFWDANDTWRDWFSPVVWSHQRGAYNTWLSIYPPLSFVLFKIFSTQSCYPDFDINLVRYCDWVGIVTLHGLYVGNIFLTSWVMLRLDRRTALPRAFALCAGMPMLFGLERGNIVLLCYTFILLAFGPLVKRAWARWLFVGLAVNLKVYLIAGVLAQLLRRRWLWFEGSVLAVIVVWLLSYAIFGAGSPIEVYANITNWASQGGSPSFQGVWYPNTFVPLRNVLVDPGTPLYVVMGSRQIELLATLVTGVVRLGQGLIALAAVATWLRPEAVTRHRVTFLGIAMAMITSETSPYTQPMLLFFVFNERWTGVLRPMALVCAYLLCVPGDIAFGGVAYTPQYSFLFQRYALTEQSLGLSMFARPMLLLLLTYFLSLHTILTVWRDLRGQGWAERWRLRRDAPLLPLVRKPRPLHSGEATAMTERNA